MYSKCGGEVLNYFCWFLNLIVNIFCKMYKGKYDFGKQDDSGNPRIYIFKPFHYQKIIPNLDCKVPYPRSGHRIGADSSNLYSYGGYNPWMRNDIDQTDEEYWTYPLFQELWKFNFASKQWIKFPNSHSLPSEVASSALVLHGNVLMVYGGTGSPFGARCSNRVHVCRINEDNGSMLEVEATGDVPVPLYGQALIYHQQYLYTIGGTTGASYNCDIHRLNLDKLEWEVVYLCNSQGDYEPRGRYRHEVGFDGQKIYLLGGGTNDESYGFRYVPTFDIKKRNWIKQKTRKDQNYGYPAARRCHGAVQITTERGSQVFIIAGHDNEHTYADLWRLDLNSYEWTCFPTCKLPNPTFFHATAITPEGRLYVFGGNYCSSDETERSNDIYSTWLCIPKLNEICWEAVLHYFPRIYRCDTDRLIDIGIPKGFVDRINSKNEDKL